MEWKDVDSGVTNFNFNRVLKTSRNLYLYLNDKVNEIEITEKEVFVYCFYTNYIFESIEDNNYLGLIKVLDQANNTSVFKMQFVIALVEMFWHVY